MSDDDLTARIPSASASGARRGWRCPDESLLAAFAEGNVAGARREELEAHVADCAYCCGQLGFLLSAGELGPPPAVPARLLAAAQGVRTPFFGQLRPATLVAAGAGIVLALLVATPWGRPGFPGEPATTGDVRGARTAAAVDAVPRILRPLEGESLRRSALDLTWAETPDALFYTVEVVEADGAVAWDGRAEAARLAIPAAAPLVPGRTYYARVLAHLRSGATVPSPAVGFRLEPG
ncbi:MAG: zf-HC2 domain-containing protein [Thermoanaerobaculia bacterium]